MLFFSREFFIYYGRKNIQKKETLQKETLKLEAITEHCNTAKNVEKVNQYPPTFPP